MKAPEKVYVTIPSRLQGDSPNYVGIAFKNRDHLTTPQIEEYIRKDALLEWLKEQEKNAIDAIAKGLPLNGKLALVARFTAFLNIL